MKLISKTKLPAALQLKLELKMLSTTYGCDLGLVTQIYEETDKSLSLTKRHLIATKEMLRLLL